MHFHESKTKPSVKFTGPVADDVVGQRWMDHPQFGHSGPGTLSDMPNATNNTVFVRPNLKVFLLGAVVLLVLQHVISSGLSQGSTLPRAMTVNARELTDTDIQEMLHHATENPEPGVYMRISQAYEKRGDYRKALLFLRRAEKLSQIQEPGE